MIRTFIDSGVLIQAIRGEEKLANKALEILEDTNREFASSIFLKMEVLPKAIYNNQPGEVQFYQEYFESVTYWAMDINQIIERLSRSKSIWFRGNGCFTYCFSIVLKGDRVYYQRKSE